jgi:hypothetical protein
MKKSLQAFSTRPLLLCFRTIFVAASITVALFFNALAQENETPDYSDEEVPEVMDISPIELNTDGSLKQSNKLWTAYMAWMHKVMLCLADDDPSDYAIRRLLKNQDAVDEAMEFYYSDNFGKKLSELLYAHKAIAAEIKRAATAGDNEAHAEACQQLRINKNEVMEFLRQSNPLYTVALSER